MPYTLPQNQTRFAEIERKAGTRADRSAAEYKHRAAVYAANVILGSRRHAKKNTHIKTITRQGNNVVRLQSELSPIFNVGIDSQDTNILHGAQVVYRKELSYEKRTLVPQFLGELAIKSGTANLTETYSVARYEASSLAGQGFQPIESPSIVPVHKDFLNIQPSGVIALDSFLQDTEFIATNNNIQLMPHDLLFG